MYRRLSCLILIFVIVDLSSALDARQSQILNLNYRYGFNIGDNLKDVYYKTIEQVKANKELNSKQFNSESIKKHIDILNRYYPDYIKRLEGLADVLNVPLEKLIETHLKIASIFNYGCTNMACAKTATKDGKNYVTWNADFYASFKILFPIAFDLPLYTLTDVEGSNRYMTMGIPLIAGFGHLNDKGLGLTTSAVHSEDNGSGLTVFELTSMVMEKCSDVPCAVKTIESLPRASSPVSSLFTSNYLLVDSLGNIATVEATHNYFAVNYGENGILAQANHHQFLDRALSGGLGPDNNGYPSSWIRAGRAWDLLKDNYGNIDITMLETFTTDTENGINIMGKNIGGNNSISRNMFPFGWLDYYAGSLTGKYYYMGKPAAFADPVILLPDQTDFSIIIDVNDKVIWWAGGHPGVVKHLPIYCAKYLGTKGGTLSEKDSDSAKMLNRYVETMVNLGTITNYIPENLRGNLSALINGLLQ
jgi:predicted choloylglycine hydrolase